MKNCSYCGRENGDEATQCWECGTEFKVPAPTPTELPTHEPQLPEYVFPPLSAHDRTKDLVTLVRCRTLGDADQVLSRLRGAGIEALIPDEYLMEAAAWFVNTFGYVRVQVAPKDYDAAREVLSVPDA